jgi:hypothetical protein
MEPVVHLGVWQDRIDYFIKLFKDELPPLFFEIFAYIHFLTFLSVFPPFPHAHTEIAHVSSAGGWGSARSTWGCGSLRSLPRVGKQPGRKKGFWPRTKDVIMDTLSIQHLFPCEGPANEIICHAGLLLYSFCRDSESPVLKNVAEKWRPLDLAWHF